MSSLRKTALAGFLLAALFFMAELFFVGLTNDTNALLQFAGLLPKEGDIYAAWVQFNTPLTLLIYLPPSLLAESWHIDPAFALHGYIGLLSLLSMLILSRDMRSYQPDPDDARIFWLSASAFTLFAIPSLSHVFADREHLLFIFILPWLVQMMLAREPSKITTVFACLGFFLKPYDIVFFILPQLLAGPPQKTLRQKIFAPSTFIATAMAAIYACVIVLFFPAYVTRIAPLLLTTYSYLAEPLSHKLLNAFAILGVAMLLAFECIPLPSSRRAWYGLLCAGLLVYCLNAGWNYTLYVLFAPLTLFFFRLWHYAAKQEAHRIPVSSVRALAGIGAALLLGLGIRSIGQDIEHTKEDGFSYNYIHLPQSYYKQLKDAAGDQFILLSTTLWQTNIAGLGHAPHMVFAHDCLWTLPWLLAHQDDANAPEIRQELENDLLLALDNHPEANLIVDASPTGWKIPRNTDLLSFFETNAALKKKLADYREISTLDDCAEKRDPALEDAMCRFTVLHRKPAIPR